MLRWSGPKLQRLSVAMEEWFDMGDDFLLIEEIVAVRLIVYIQLLLVLYW